MTTTKITATATTTTTTETTASGAVKGSEAAEANRDLESKNSHGATSCPMVRVRRTQRARRLVSILLTPLILYHLLAVALLPNGGSVEGRAFMPYLATYANQLGFNTPWQFFSPGPSPTLYLEYEIEASDDPLGLNSEPRIWPPPKTDFGFDDRYSRSLYSMRFFALNDERLERYFVPWFCKRHSGADAIHVRAVVEEISELAKSEWVGETLSDLSRRVEYGRRRFSCPRPEDDHAK